MCGVLVKDRKRTKDLMLNEAMDSMAVGRPCVQCVMVMC